MKIKYLYMFLSVFENYILFLLLKYINVSFFLLIIVFICIFYIILFRWFICFYNIFCENFLNLSHYNFKFRSKRNRSLL